MDAHLLDHPPAIVWEARKKKGQRSRKAALAVGMIIILADGRRCQVIGFQPDRTPICHFPDEP